METQGSINENKFVLLILEFENISKTSLISVWLSHQDFLNAK